MLFGRRVSFTSASGVPRRVRHEDTINSVYSTAVHRSKSAWPLSDRVRTVSAVMQDSSPPPTHASSPTSECRWKRGRPIAPPRYTGDSRHSTSRLWVRDLPIRFAQSSPVALAARQESDQQNPSTCQTTPASDGKAEVPTITSERCKHLQSPRPLRFTPTTGKRGLHTTSTATRSRMAHQPDTSSGPSVHARTAYDDGEGGFGTKQQDTESMTLPIDRYESQTNSTTGHSNGSECMANQDREIQSDESGNDEYEEEDNMEQHVPLAFQIPDDVLRAAMLASPNTRASYWSQKLYRGPENRQISTHYCRSPQVAERVAQHFLNEKVVGFDVEWKPRANPASIKMNASLIQLACEDRIALFHISLFPGTSAQQLMPPTLKAILESPSIYKVGVAIKGDFSRLNKFLDIQAQGVFELSRLHNDLELHATEPDKVSNKLVGLAAQVLRHLQLPLYKGGPLDDQNLNSTNVRESDWSQPLDLQQIHYAAADAYAGFRLYHVLDWKRKQLKPVPPRRGLCDYDSKPAPRTKDVQKKPRAARKPKEQKGTVPEQTALATSQEQREVDEVEEDDSVPEELMDSHQLEDPQPASEFAHSEVTTDVATLDAPQMDRIARLEDNKVQMHKKIGRVNLSWLKDPNPGYPILPDPGYPDLPKTHEQDNASSSQEQSLDGCPKVYQIGCDQGNETDGSLIKDGVGEEEDEFADPELERTLMAMYTGYVGVVTGDPRGDDFPNMAAFDQLQEQNMSIQNAMLKEKNISASIRAANPGPNTAEHQEKDIATDLSEHDPANDNLHEAETAPTSTPPPLADQTEDKPHIQEFDLATQWAQTYLRSTVPSPASKAASRIRATTAHLRSYHMWHHQQLALNEIAKLLRDPPFSHTTVSSYILQAITLENLDYDKTAARDVLMAMPEGMRKGRWKWLAQTVGALS